MTNDLSQSFKLKTFTVSYSLDSYAVHIKREPNFESVIIWTKEQYPQLINHVHCLLKEFSERS